MDNQYILSPYFLDDEVPGLASLAQPEWHVIAADLPAAKTAADRSAAEPSANERQARMAGLYQPFRDAVAGAAGRGKRPVSIAGDCCTSLAVFAGLQKAGLNPNLIWFDAHGDFNTWETTPSGFLGGMPLAMLVGRGEQTLPQSVGLRTVPEADVLLTDARDLDPGERLAVEASNVKVLRDPAALLGAPLPDGPLYVHFDSDILDPSEAPAMSYLAPGGPSSETLRQVFQRLAASGQIAAVSLSAWNPKMDEDGASGDLVMSLLAELVV